MERPPAARDREGCAWQRDTNKMQLRSEKNTVGQKKTAPFLIFAITSSNQAVF